MKSLLRDLARQEKGQDLIEYALLGSLLSIVSIVALTGLGKMIRNEWTLIHFIIKG